MSTRTRSGCITCRIRRVKCDETRPVCQKCTTSRRTCDGYLDANYNVSRRRLAVLMRELGVVGPVVGPVSRALTPSPPSLPDAPSTGPRMVARDQDAFFFNLFRQVTVPSTCGLFPSSFWQIEVLQLAHAEPALWHATVALGLLHHSRSESVPGREAPELDRRAARHYGRAMALANGLDAPVKLATLSIVLVAVASMLDRYSELQMHVLAGLKFITDDDTSNRNQNNRLQHRQAAITRSLEGALMRADMQAMTFSDSSSPYPWGESAAIYAADRYLAMPVIADESQLSYDGMSSELFGLCRTYMLLDDGFLMGNLTYGPWMTRLEGLYRKLMRWEERMALLEEQQQQQQQRQDTSAVTVTRLSLRLYHSMIRTFLRAQPFGPETRYDLVLANFEYMYRLTSTIHAILAAQSRTSPGATSERRSSLGISLEPGLIIPLWIVTHRCRHRRLRRAALRLLSQMNRVEGTWKSGATAKVLGACLAKEEEGLPLLETTTSENDDMPVLDASWFDANVPWSIWSRPNVEIPSTLSWADAPHVPEEKRVKDILGKVNNTKHQVDVRLLMTPTDDGEPYGPAIDVVVDF